MAETENEDDEVESNENTADKLQRKLKRHSVNQQASQTRKAYHASKSLNADVDFDFETFKKTARRDIVNFATQWEEDGETIREKVYETLCEHLDDYEGFRKQYHSKAIEIEQVLTVEEAWKKFSNDVLDVIENENDTSFSKAEIDAVRPPEWVLREAQNLRQRLDAWEGTANVNRKLKEYMEIEGESKDVKVPEGETAQKQRGLKPVDVSDDQVTQKQLNERGLDLPSILEKMNASEDTESVDYETIPAHDDRALGRQTKQEGMFGINEHFHELFSTYTGFLAKSTNVLGHAANVGLYLQGQKNKQQSKEMKQAVYGHVDRELSHFYRYINKEVGHLTIKDIDGIKDSLDKLKNDEKTGKALVELAQKIIDNQVPIEPALNAIVDEFDSEHDQYRFSEQLKKIIKKIDDREEYEQEYHKSYRNGVDRNLVFDGKVFDVPAGVPEDATPVAVLDGVLQNEAEALQNVVGEDEVDPGQVILRTASIAGEEYPAVFVASDPDAVDEDETTLDDYKGDVTLNRHAPGGIVSRKETYLDSFELSFDEATNEGRAEILGVDNEDGKGMGSEVFGTEDKEGIDGIGSLVSMLLYKADQSEHHVGVKEDDPIVDVEPVTESWEEARDEVGRGHDDKNLDYGCGHVSGRGFVFAVKRA